VLNDDKGIDEALLQWALAQIAQAKADGQQIIGMAHHPSLPPSPVWG
jgi:hypothetical protein